MRKLFVMLILAALLLAQTACQSGSQTAASSPAAFKGETTVSVSDMAKILNGKNIGTLYRYFPESDFEKYTREDYAEYVSGFTTRWMYFDSLTDGLLMLRSNKIDLIQTMRSTARYLAQRNPDMQVYVDNDWEAYTHLLFNLDMQSQYERINSVIKKMNEDGTMQQLVKKWITDLPVGGEPAGGKIEVIKGADTVKVGISGDQPPLDYIAASGSPGGFNVAVLSEISRRARINIEIVTVTGSGRFSALESGKIDAFLWHNGAKNDSGVISAPQTVLKIGNYALLMSEKYLESGSALVAIKK